MTPAAGQLSEDDLRELARLVRQIHDRAEAKRQQDGDGGDDRDAA